MNVVGTYLEDGVPEEGEGQAEDDYDCGSVVGEDVEWEVGCEELIDAFGLLILVVAVVAFFVSIVFVIISISISISIGTLFASEKNDNERDGEKGNFVAKVSENG